MKISCTNVDDRAEIMPESDFNCFSQDSFTFGDELAKYPNGAHKTQYFSVNRKLKGTKFETAFQNDDYL